jgi:hypothetical protein
MWVCRAMTACHSKAPEISQDFVVFSPFSCLCSVLSSLILYVICFMSFKLPFLNKLLVIFTVEYVRVYFLNYYLSTGVQHDVHIRWCSCRLKATQWVLLVEHSSSSPGFSGVRVVQALVFCVVFWISLFVLLYFFLCIICLCFIGTNYPFVIVKLFFD